MWKCVMNTEYLMVWVHSQLFFLNCCHASFSTDHLRRSICSQTQFSSSQCSSYLVHWPNSQMYHQLLLFSSLGPVPQILPLLTYIHPHQTYILQVVVCPLYLYFHHLIQNMLQIYELFLCIDHLNFLSFLILSATISWKACLLKFDIF